MGSLAAIRATLALARARLERQPHSNDPLDLIANQIRATAHMCAQLAKATMSFEAGSPPHLYTPELTEAERFLLEAADEAVSGHRDAAVKKISKAQQLLGGM